MTRRERNLRRRLQVVQDEIQRQRRERGTASGGLLEAEHSAELELVDWTEQDAMAAESERLEMYRNEY